MKPECKLCAFYSYFPTLSKDVGYKVAKCSKIGTIPLVLMDCPHYKEKEVLK